MGDPASHSAESVREAQAVGAIARALLGGDRLEAVLPSALERATPLVGAAFASVHVVDAGSDRLHLSATYSVPENFLPCLGDGRVRLGDGPSGEAAAERRVIEVIDVFADRDLGGWKEAAGDPGVGSLVALPLQTGRRVLGVLTFYFSDSGRRTPASRVLMRIVADLVAGTIERAGLYDEVHRAEVVLSDTTAQLERQHSALVEARRVKDEFLSNISHELRTPLTTVMGYVSILQEELSGPLNEGQRSDLSHVKRASERLLALVEDLLELTSLVHGHAALSMEEFELAAVVREAVAAAHARVADVELVVEEPRGFVPRIRSDRRKIARILVTLLDNAYKFTARGRVTLSVECRNDRVVLSVRDSGIGIAPEQHDVVFDEFRQVDGSVTRRYGGAGIGLALARRLARMLGGDIGLASAVGDGCLFTVEIPFQHDPIGDDAGAPNESLDH